MAALWLMLVPVASCRTRAQPVAVDPAEAAFRRGDYARALELARGGSRLRTALLRGLLARERGDAAAMRTEFAPLAQAFEAASLRRGADLADAGEALQYLGRLHDANRAFQQAAAAAGDADVRVRWGRLYLATYNAAEAQRLFDEALKLEASHPGALSGLAEVFADRWDAGGEKYLDRALEADAEFVPAMLLSARMALEEDHTDRAEQQIARVLALRPSAAGALALRAVIAYQRGNSQAMEKELAEVFRVNPRYGEAYALLGHFAVLRRQFAEAADFYRHAVERDPALWKAHSELGITLLRLGQDERAREALEIAYKGDPFNAWTVNTLRLMDSFARYERFETPHFRVKLHQKEAGALRPYVEQILERAITTLGARYRFLPREKVSFEMFPDHEDFAVRTLGLPGLGALGASFGAVVAMDSPAARPAGTFHWAGTLWHEVGHVVTLQASGNRVPRWFTEGLSVWEEHRAGWGDPLDLDTVRALKENKLMPVAQLNAGFIRPRYPGQVQFAYYQAGMLCRYIEEKHGFEKILELLAAFREGQTTEAGLQRALGMPPEKLDKAFREWFDPQVAPLLQALDLEWRQPRPREALEAEVARHPNNFFAQLHLARALTKEGKKPEAKAATTSSTNATAGADAPRNSALRHAQAARDLFPGAVDEGGPYELAADLLQEAGQREQAAAELERWLRAGGRHPATVRKLATLLAELGRPAESAAALERLLYIVPLDADLHQKLGEHYLSARRAQEAVREFGVVLALQPVDMAQAHFNLARALMAASQTTEARRQVLAALEIAPGFSPAQKLLLELTDK